MSKMPFSALAFSSTSKNDLNDQFSPLFDSMCQLSYMNNHSKKIISCIPSKNDTANLFWRFTVIDRF